MLTSLDFYKFLPTSLHKLDLRVNLIESLEEENGEMVNFGHLHKMEDIYISQNLWICSCNFEHLLKLYGDVIEDKENTDCQNSNGNYPMVVDAIDNMNC
jgi:hypothetical protein